MGFDVSCVHFYHSRGLDSFWDDHGARLRNGWVCIIPKSLFLPSPLKCTLCSLINRFSAKLRLVSICESYSSREVSTANGVTAGCSIFDPACRNPYHQCQMQSMNIFWRRSSCVVLLSIPSLCDKPFSPTILPLAETQTMSRSLSVYLAIDK